MASAKINLFVRDGIWRYAVLINGITSQSGCGYVDKEEARQYAEARARELVKEEAAAEEYDYEVPDAD